MDDVVDHFEFGQGGKQGAGGLARLPVLEQIHDTNAAGHGKGGIADKTGDDVGDEPVALQGRDQRLDFLAELGGKRGIGHAHKGKGHGKSAQNPVLVLPLKAEVENGNGPGEKDQGLVHVGKGRIADAGLIRFLPAQGDACGIDQKGAGSDQRGGKAEFFCPKNKDGDVEYRGEKIGKGCNAQEL